MEHCLTNLKIRFPRLTAQDFSYSEKDRVETVSTPAGNVDVLYFHEREDFEKALIALAYKNEPRAIPKAIGAMFISGIADYKAMEKTCILVLSHGNYSAIPPETVGLPAGEWLEKSYIIRKNHEIAHFIQRKLFPQNKDALKDEVKADMAGLFAAFGKYDTKMARIFLGTEGSTYREGGRLQNYLDEGESIDEAMLKVNAYIDRIASFISETRDAFENLIEIEKSEEVW